MTLPGLARLRRHAAALSVLALLGLGAAGFLETADEVREGEWRRLDERLLLAMRSDGAPEDPVGPLWFEEGMRDLTALGGLTVLSGVTLAVLGALLLQGRRREALLTAVIVVGGALASTGLKAVIDRPRPELITHGMHAYQSSFPSGHSMMAAVVYLTLAAMLARLQRRRAWQAYVLGLGVAVTLLVGVSRVYLGVHWPTDVLGGWAAGLAWAALGRLAFLALAVRGEVRHG